MYKPVRRHAESVAVLLLSAIAVAAFWYEYLPPFKRVLLPFDLEGYHFPLIDYAFQRIRAGDFPEWDASIYCGIPFAGNVAAGLFYPPLWILFAYNAGRPHVSYTSIEVFTIAHVWAAFSLFYLWFRRRGGGLTAALLGASVFAFSGYLVSQISHLGVTIAYALIPLGLWGADEAAYTGRWRPLWKVAAASALAFLGGFPPAWVVCCAVWTVYAAATGRWRAAAGTVGAIGVSLLIAMVQILPAAEASALKTYDPKYGAGFKNPATFLNYLLPNYVNFSDPALLDSPLAIYLYLGAPALLGLLLVFAVPWRHLIPALLIAIVCVIFAVNPYAVVWDVIRHSQFLAQVIRSVNFLAGITVAAALLSAVTLDELLKREQRRVPRAAAVLVLVALAVRASWLMQMWPEQRFAIGWPSVWDAAIATALLGLGVFAARGSTGALRVALSAAIVVGTLVEYKVFSTSRPFNAGKGELDLHYRGEHFAGMSDQSFRLLRSHPEYRVAVGDMGPHATDLRHHGLATPQGFDAFLPAQYRKFIEDRSRPFKTDRLFDLKPEDTSLLPLLGVRYFVVTPHATFLKDLASHPDYQSIDEPAQFFRLFEFRKGRPAYYWADDAGGSARVLEWRPEKRRFSVESAGGLFVLAEQFYPGWRAEIDGKPVEIQRWSGTFQSVRVPPGPHDVSFRYGSPGLRLGAAISIASTAVLLFLLYRTRTR